ncbi:hypothetical protein [Marinobacterium sp. MBR-111]
MYKWLARYREAGAETVG